MLSKDLKERAAAGKPVSVSLVGAGQMGEGLVAQMELMGGSMAAMAVADVIPGRAAAALKGAGIDPKLIVETNDPDTAAQAVSEGKRVASTNAKVASAVPVEVVVEATGIPEVGAVVALDAIMARRHMVQMNVETDATVGYILRKMANAAGIVYTLTAGDEPGSTMELYDFAVSLGFEVVAAGKGKNNPLNRASNPDSAREKAERQQMNPKMLAGFEDGTKTMVEMTSLGNAIGFTPDVRGMHGPQVTPKTIAQTYSPKSKGGIFEREGLKTVDYGLGIAPGVFVVFTTDHPKISRDLAYLSMGPGPYWALYRPYHLTSLETPISIARAALYGQTTIATDIPPVCETVAYAKKDLKAGEKIDALGGFTVYGMIASAEDSVRENLLPLGLAPGATLVKDVRMGDPVTYADVEIIEDQVIVDLRRMQDRMLKA